MDFDIIIVGSGVVGATVALLLAKNPQLSIGILEAKQPEFNQPHRVSAISPASKNIFESINIWNEIKNISAYQKMFVWDARGRGKIEFDGNEVSQASLGFIVEDAQIRCALHEKILQHKNIQFICPVEITALQEKNNTYELKTIDKIFTAKIIIAADGANSFLRTQANIESKTRDYQQMAIVATVNTELSHQQTAWQRFLKTGPLAFLPLQNEFFSSIVWSTSKEQADLLMQCSDEEFKIQLAESFDYKLGKIIALEKRFVFPLRMQHAKQYLKNNLILMGDAAHTIHPLAGQGVNLGIMDAKCFADKIKQNQDIFNFKMLRNYERSRKSENAIMLATVDTLKNLFASESIWLSAIRTLGLNATNKISVVKNFLVNHAMGSSL